MASVRVPSRGKFISHTGGRGASSQHAARRLFRVCSVRKQFEEVRRPYMRARRVRYRCHVACQRLRCSRGGTSPRPPRALMRRGV